MTANDPQTNSLWRILDANANRAAEGLRVVEDFTRFALDDAHLARLVKELRHDLTAALGGLSHEQRTAARATQRDVGAAINTPAETSRTTINEVLAASFKRVEQALRCLEEYGKLLSSDTGARFEQLRYRTYSLEQAVMVTHRAITRLAHARLYVLMDGGATEEDFMRRASALIAAGVQVLQLRDKQLDDRMLLARARRLRELTADSGALFIMNDRADLAFLARADGVHVGQEELTVKDARAIVGPRSLVGVSTHSLEQARAAVLDGADYIGVGPTFPSTTKEFAAFPGLDLLRRISAEIRLPAFAIGGVTRENLRQVQACGVSRVAVSGAVHHSPDPAAAARELLSLLGTDE